MAKAENPGSDRGELKKLLKAAGDKPVSMAFAMAKDGTAMVKLDKLKPPRALEKMLKESEGSKNHRFGTVVIDPAEPKIAKFVVNKEVGGFARKLVVALKGTGFSKVKLVTEDGQSLEDAAGEEEGEEDQAEPGAAPHATAQDSASSPSQPQATPSPPPQNGAAADQTQAPPAEPDAGALAKDLTGLVKQMLAAIAQNPSQKGQLADLATKAQASLKSGDLGQASASIDALRQAIAGAGSSNGAAPAGASETPDAGGPDPAMIQKLQKSQAVWDATLTKINADMDKLVKAVSSASKDHELGATFEKDFQTAVEPLLTTVDKSLSDLLARAAKAGSADEHEKVLDEARATVKRFTKFAQSHPVIDHLDKNPFVPMAVGKTLTATLTAVATIIH